MLDIIDDMKHLIPKMTILHVYNPQKIYMLLRERGDAVYTYLKERYPENLNPRIAVEIK